MKKPPGDPDACKRDFVQRQLWLEVVVDADLNGVDIDIPGWGPEAM
jgi:hypothetical protein